MAKRLTKKEKGVADDYIETGNGTQAALKYYNTTDTDSAASIASKVLSKDKVRAYLESKAETVATVVYTLATTSENDMVKLNASKDILDRSGYKPVEKSINLNVEAEITNPHAKELAEKYEEELKKGL